MNIFHRPLATLALTALLCPLAQAQQPPPAPVSIGPAIKERFAPILWSPASVVSRGDARVAAEQDGRVVFVAEVGDVIAKGGVLAKLDEQLLQLRERELRAELARIGAQLDYAVKQERRLAQLAEQSTISGAALDEARSQKAVLQQERKRAEIALQTARHRLANAVVRAPFAGTVAERFIEAGEYLGIGAPVLRLVDTGNVEVQARAPVALATHVQPGMQLTLRGDGAEQRGRVRAVVPVGDASSRQFELRLALDASHWPIGSALEVGLPSAAPREVVAVPRDALLLRPGEAFVLRVADDDSAERVPVRTGSAQGEWIEVSGDVQAGDRLIVRGGERLQPGQKVRIEALHGAGGPDVAAGSD
jgi:RND family efflux transporter MFP subunit